MFVRCVLQKLLEGSLLEGLIGAVDDVRFKVMTGVILYDVTDVLDQRMSMVTFFQILKKADMYTKYLLNTRRGTSHFNRAGHPDPLTQRKEQHTLQECSKLTLNTTANIFNIDE